MSTLLCGRGHQEAEAHVEEPATIDAYLEALPQPAQRILRRVRTVITKAVPDAEESLSYGIPTWKRGGKPLLYAAAWKAHWALYPVSAKELAALGSDLEVESQGTLQFLYSETTPVHLIAALAQLKASAAGAKRKTRRTKGESSARAPSTARPRARARTPARRTTRAT